MSYSHIKTITVDHLKVVNTAQTNFPVLLSTTDAELRSIQNGGFISNANGYDIAFYLTNDLSGSRLPHEIDNYNPTTGKVEIWIKLPTLSNSSDTVFYMAIGDNSIAVSQENKSDLWTDFLAVYHFGTPSLISVSDSKGVNNGVNNGVTASTGKIGGAGNFISSSSQYINVGSNASIKPTTDFSISAWAKTSQINTIAILFSMFGNSGSNYDGYRLAQLDAGFGNKMSINTFNNTSGTLYGKMPNSTYNNNTWNKYTAIIKQSNSSYEFYANNVNSSTNMGSGYTSPLYLNSPVGVIGALNYNGGRLQYWNGQIDELRIYNGVLSKDWSDTEYNNQNDPSTFLSISTAIAISGGVIPDTSKFFLFF